jgi:hypothetical protein
MGKRSDETVERPGGQRAIDPTVSFGQLRVVVVRARQNFERSRAAHEARRVLDGARAEIVPIPGSGWPKIADSRTAKRMSHASTNSLPAPRTRPEEVLISIALA